MASPVTQEIFLPIPGYSRYLINNCGVVKRIAHDIEQVNRWGNLISRHKKERVVKPRVSNKGYLRLALCEADRIDYSVHRLVLITFKPNTENLPQINHIDGDKMNNHVDNLEWCTSSHNVQHSFDLGLNYAARGFDDNQNKPVRLLHAGGLINVFGSIGEASRQTKLKRCTIRRSCNSGNPISNRSNIGGGFKFEYYEQ